MGSLQLGTCTALQHRMAPAVVRRRPPHRTLARAASMEHGAQSITLPAVDEVPIVDLAELRFGCRDQATLRVAAACRDWGFFQVCV